MNQLAEDLSQETQKRVYTIWANNVLSKRNLVIVDLLEDLKDGVILINLLEILTSEKSGENYNAKPKNRLHQLANAQVALNFINRWGINLVNFRPEHLVDKHIKMILSLVWRVISRFQIQQQIQDQSISEQQLLLVGDSESDAASDDGLSLTTSIASGNKRNSTTGKTTKEVLFRWCKKELEIYPSINITNFNKSFQNAQILYSLILKFLPQDSIGMMNTIQREDDIEGLQKCLDLAEKHLSIPKLLSAQQIIEGPIDENCIMTYVSYFLNYQRNGTTIPIVTNNNNSNINNNNTTGNLSTSISSNNISSNSTNIISKGHNRASSTGSDSNNGGSGSGGSSNNLNNKPNSPNGANSSGSNSTSNNGSKRPILKRSDTLQTPEKSNVFSSPVGSPMADRSPRPQPQLQRQLSSSQIQQAATTTTPTSITTTTTITSTSSASTPAHLVDILALFTQELKRITEEHEQMLIKTTTKLDEKVSRLGDKIDQLENKILSIKEVVDQTTEDYHKKRHSKKSTPVSPSPSNSNLIVLLDPNNNNTTTTTTIIDNSNNNSNLITSPPISTTKSPSPTSLNNNKHHETKEERRERRRSRRKEKEEKKSLKSNGANLTTTTTTSSSSTENITKELSLSPSSSSCSLTDDAQVDREEIKKIIRVQSIARGFLARKQYKRIKTRRGVAQEILRTEESYVANLKILLTDFLKPLKEESMNLPLLVDNVKTLYNNIEVIHGMNNMLLMKLKERMTKAWHYRQLYGDIFFKMSDLLKCYIAYVNHYNRTLNTINDFTKHQVLNDIIAKTFEKTRQQLRDLVIIPVQRIPRYVLLLEELVKATESSHPDHHLLTQALTKMQSIADHVNEKRRDFENVTHVSLLQEAIIGFNIMEYSSLRYVMEGDLMSNVYTSSGSGFGNAIAGVVNNAVSGTSSSSMELTKGMSSTLHVFLFNQMIVVCKYKKGKDSYFTNKNLFGSSSEKHKSKQPKYKYLSHHILISDTKISHNKSENWFGVDNNGDYRRFFAKTVAEKDMWIQHIQTGISKATEIKNIKSNR